MSTEIVKAQPVTASLPDMVRYAEHLANANLLPGQYRKQPANVLYAMEYGRTLGITPLAAITGIHVIEGKPSASAALIGGLVRQAGHKLRVKGNSQSATAQIIRADDPDFVYEVTWELRRNERGNPNAEDAKLLNKEVWQKYAAAMLKSRAITQVARDACEEVLFGLHYTPEELGAYVDQDGNPVDAPVQPLRSVPQDQPQRGGMVQVGNFVIDSECFVPHPEGQKFAARASKVADRAGVTGVVGEAKAAELINSGISAPDSGEPEVLRDYLARLWMALPERAPVEAEQKAEPDDGIQDAEVVPDSPDSPDSEHAAAVAELRKVAEQVGLTAELDNEFYSSYGLPIAEAHIDNVREMTRLLRGEAA